MLDLLQNLRTTVTFAGYGTQALFAKTFRITRILRNMMLQKNF